MVKAVTLVFCSIQYHFIWHICAKFGISFLPQSLDIAPNSDEGVSDFRISGQSLIKRNCHKSRTSDDIDMKIGPVTTRDKRKKQQQKSLTFCNVGKLWRHCYFSNLRSIWSNAEVGFRTHSNLLSYKKWKQSYKIFNTVLTLLLWVKVLFWPKNTDFLQTKLLITAKLRGSWY